MPQIANQDYNIFKVTDGLIISNDAALLAALMKANQQGTIFDVLVVDRYFRMVVAAADDVFGIAGPRSVDQVRVDYTFSQYEGLAAIQAAAIAEGITVNMIPDLCYGIGPHSIELGANGDEDGDNSPIVDEDGNVYSVTSENEKVVAVQKTQHEPEYGWAGTPLVVPFEEVQKLIGIPV